jgi:Domain of unknown function (DUF4111)
MPMWMSDAEAEAVLALLVDGQRTVLGADLAGSYLFGSGATGAFEPGVSDLDTVAVLRSDPTEMQLEGLRVLHASIVRAKPEWDDRVEVVYLSTHALTSFRATSPAARISPGEPFHPIEVDHRWLIDWYQLRAVGIALHGPPVDQVAPLITREEYVEGLRQHPSDPGWLDATVSPGACAYAILSMCRGLRTCRTGEHVSKREGASWASRSMPEDAALIGDALAWRGRPKDPVWKPPRVNGNDSPLHRGGATPALGAAPIRRSGFAAHPCENSLIHSRRSVAPASSLLARASSRWAAS